MDKRFWAIIGVIVAVFVGFLVFRGDGNQSTSGSNSSSSSSNAQPTNHVEGNPTSKVTLLEYGDYQCPACESFFQVTQVVHEKYKDTVKFQFRNLPLTQLHPNAFSAARAAEAAALQNKFWEMHDLLYLNSNWTQWTQSKNPVSYYEQYAKQLGLDLTTFRKDFKSSAVNDSINADVTAFSKTGQETATPAFFLNGTFIKNGDLLDSNGQPSEAAFSKLIDAALAKNQ